MRTPALISAALLSLTLLAPAAVAETREERLEVARSYTEMTVQDMDISAVIGLMYLPTVDLIKASGQTITDEEVAQLEAVFMEVYAAKMTDIFLANDEIMADMFTLAEIEALKEFYETPQGKVVLNATNISNLTSAEFRELEEAYDAFSKTPEGGDALAKYTDFQRADQPKINDLIISEMHLVTDKLDDTLKYKIHEVLN